MTARNTAAASTANSSRRYAIRRQLRTRTAATGTGTTPAARRGRIRAVAAVTDWLLSQPGVRQVRAHTLTSNAPSRRVLEKAGFTYVGLDEGEALYQRPAAE